MKPDFHESPPTEWVSECNLKETWKVHSSFEFVGVSRRVHSHCAQVFLVTVGPYFETVHMNFPLGFLSEIVRHQSPKRFASLMWDAVTDIIKCSFDVTHTDIYVHWWQKDFVKYFVRLGLFRVGIWRRRGIFGNCLVSVLSGKTLLPPIFFMYFPVSAGRCWIVTLKQSRSLLSLKFPIRHYYLYWFSFVKVGLHKLCVGECSIATFGCFTAIRCFTAKFECFIVTFGCFTATFECSAVTFGCFTM
jgi:hypothetical protein